MWNTPSSCPLKRYLVYITYWFSRIFLYNFFFFFLKSFCTGNCLPFPLTFLVPRENHTLENECLKAQECLILITAFFPLQLVFSRSISNGKGLVYLVIVYIPVNTKGSIPYKNVGPKKYYYYYYFFLLFKNGRTMVWPRGEK